MKSLLITLILSASCTFLLEAGIPFTLRNNGLTAIPLEIPGVMNPNLSPMSNSGVELAIGQKIYFTYLGERCLLLEVDEALANTTVDVRKLIRQRRQELDLQ